MYLTLIRCEYIYIYFLLHKKIRSIVLKDINKASINLQVL